jgi:hypothetical protein
MSVNVDPETFNQLLSDVGFIKGSMQGLRTDLTEIKTDVKGVDSRLRSVELRGAVHGAAGTAVAVGIELLKQKLGL